MKKLCFGGHLAILCWAVCGHAEAQYPFSLRAEKVTNAILDRQELGDKLECYVTQEKPFFDFSFRFEIRYLVSCPYRQFNGEQDNLVAAARVRPSTGEPVILGEIYSVPPLPENLRGKVNIKKFKDELEFSGAIAIGEGQYEIDLLVADQHERYFRKTWKVKAERHGAEKKAEISLQPNHVAPLIITNIDDRPVSKAGPVRLTVLLNAAPIYPLSRKLRAWDRAFLIGSLSSLMLQVPTASVRLIAFNTSQQKELFRADALDRKGLLKLGDTLRSLELGTVSYKTLERADGWAELLHQMVSDETTLDKRADAVVFLGPYMRDMGKIRREDLACPPEHGPQLFYLKYFPFAGEQFTDSIDHLTKDCRGRVLQFHSPGEFGAAVGKMRESLLSARQ